MTSFSFNSAKAFLAASSNLIGEFFAGEPGRSDNGHSYDALTVHNISFNENFTLPSR